MQRLTALLLLGALSIGSIACALCRDREWLPDERRRAAQFSAPTLRSLTDGSFTRGTESAAADQFPLRGTFRGIKAHIQKDIFLHLDNNGVYSVDGSFSRIEASLDENSVRAAAGKLNRLQEEMFPDSRVFYAVVPDKNYYLAAANGYPHLDYDLLDTLLAENLDRMTAIDLYDCLTVEDYYKTDSHWRQERIFGAAERIGSALGVTVKAREAYEERVYDEFRGVYWGQAALGSPAEPLVYLTDETLEGCTVTHAENETETGVYEPERFTGRDPYDVFLGGADPLLTIRKRDASSGRELILFRDSFGSSLAPLLMEGYDSVTLVDLRYISSAVLPEMVDFHGQDVLILYSPTLWNRAALLK